MTTVSAKQNRLTATRNACKLCAPLGAALVFKGIARTVPLLHGSQGCATYIRRYLIGHYREPVDIASSSFSESSAVFGGRKDLHRSLTNIIEQYHPDVIGVATTCLAETIGDDVRGYVREFIAQQPSAVLPEIVNASTPSYSGTHQDGFTAAVRAVLAHFARPLPADGGVMVLPGMVSPADLRYLRTLWREFGLRGTIFPDYADTLDGGTWERYHTMPAGGVELAQLRTIGASEAVIEFGATCTSHRTAGSALCDVNQAPLHRIPLPIGVEATDRFMTLLAQLSGHALPAERLAMRQRLIDSYVDAHKRLFERRVVLYGDDDLVVALAGLLSELGMRVVLCATGANNARLVEETGQTLAGKGTEVVCHDDVDFEEIHTLAAAREPHLLIGSSKGYTVARRLGIPLVRVGFPVHDRFGGQRIRTLGYEGTQLLLDRIVNALIDHDQRHSDIGYQTY